MKSAPWWRQTIWALAIVTAQRIWFQQWRYIGGDQRPLDQVVDGVVTHLTAGWLPASEAVCSITSDLNATNTCVWCHMMAPSRRAIARRSDVSSSRVPTAEHGTAFRKSPKVPKTFKKTFWNFLKSYFEHFLKVATLDFTIKFWIFHTIRSMRILSS